MQQEERTAVYIVHLLVHDPEVVFYLLIVGVVVLDDVHGVCNPGPRAWAARATGSSLGRTAATTRWQTAAASASPPARPSSRTAPRTRGHRAASRRCARRSRCRRGGTGRRARRSAPGRPAPGGRPAGTYAPVQ